MLALCLQSTLPLLAQDASATPAPTPLPDPPATTLPIPALPTATPSAITPAVALTVTTDAPATGAAVSGTTPSTGSDVLTAAQGVTGAATVTTAVTDLTATITATLLAPVTPAPAASTPANDPLAAQVEDILATMTPADRVGQLFVVTFEGADVGIDTDIAELILGYRVGGVVLSPRNLNFSNERGVDTPTQVATLANQLQAAAYGIELPADRALDPMPIAPWPPDGYERLDEKAGTQPINIPLLIGVAQLGDGMPGTALRRGFTPLPSQMAIGATWTPDLAQRTGEVVGRELNTVGINLLLGPSLDVFQQANPMAVSGLSISTFGGSPYWVSVLGRAYIAGIHDGGQNRVAAVTGHFPGQGSTDRPPEEQVATIQQSLDEMRRGPLLPFVATTRGPSSVTVPGGDASSTDVIMTSHMRFTAFQGGAAGRITPISVAPELRSVFTQEGFDDWRATGGVIMSDSLGVPAIRRFYSATSTDFFNRRVALDAFMAGNDLLFLSDYSLEDNWESAYANMKLTIGYFQDRYGADPDFAARVDDSVRRILRLKLGLYRDVIPQAIDGDPVTIPLPEVLVERGGVETLGGEARTEAETTMGEVARQGITILYPDPATQTDPIPPTFRTDDNILIFTDSRLQRECSTCTAEAAIGPDEIKNIIARLYGSEATGQIDPARITSLTFADLTMFLDSQQTLTATSTVSATTALTPTLEATAVLTPPVAALDLEAQPAASVDAQVQERTQRTAALIQDADWILFAMLNVEPEVYPSSNAVNRFLRQYGDELGDQRLVVFAFNAPYFLDATEMSRLTTYFGVYSKTQPFLENAVRALFRAFSITGAPPVAVPGTRFANLDERLMPDPQRPLPLTVSTGDGTVVAANAAANAGELASPALQAGVTLRLTVGPILDRNGHSVADGTPVEFALRFEGEELALAVEPALTRDGVATRDVAVDRAGTLRMAATAAEATTGEPLTLVIAAPPTPVASGDQGGDAGAAAAQNALPERVNLITLIIALFTIVVTLSLFLIVQVRVLPRATLVHNMLWAAIYGLVGYLLYGFGLFPGANWLRANVSVWGTTVVVFLPMLLPLLWLQLRGED